MAWYEPLPGFWLPPSWPYDATRWPDYTAEYIASQLEELDEISDVLVLRGWGRPSRRAWGAWLGARREGKDLRRGWPELEQIADRMYDQARYVYLVPAWRRAITRVITALDDIEDQLSTILWVAEWISRRVIPLPPRLLNGAERVRRSLDCAERVLAGVTPFRGRKSEYGQCLRQVAAERERAQKQRAGLLAWFRDNWGRLLEAAQATGQWFSVGIILGPIMAWIEEGMWGAARKTVDNYLIAADALMPGYREDFWRAAEELSEAVDRAWEETWERANSPETWQQVGEEIWTAIP